MEHSSERLRNARAVIQAPPPPRFPDEFSVGEWVVEPSLGQLSRGETVVRLRPLLMDVLICLASGEGRPVTRRFVFDTVWSNRFVTDSSLSRSVAELRQALGDDARHPKIIQTLPKRGYRIIAPIAPHEGLRAVSAEMTAPVRAEEGKSAPGAGAPAAAEIPELAAKPPAVLWAVVAGVLAVVGMALFLFA